MGLTVGTNSWATVAEADAYLTDRIGAEDWFDLNATGDPGAVSKETLLITSYNRLSVLYTIPAAETATNIKKAQIEAAFFFLDNFVEFEERSRALAAGIESFRQSQWTENYRDGITAVSFPGWITDLISEYSGANFFPQLLGEDYE